jgi:hypothetical protein
MKVEWYKSGLSCNNPILREFVYFKCLIQISKHWGIAIIKSQNKKRQTVLFSGRDREVG